MTNWRDDITWYTIPEDALLQEHGPDAGQHWVHLRTAEQLARTLGPIPAFDVAKVARMGGVAAADAVGEGFVALYTHVGDILMVGTFTCGDIQFPTTREGLTGDEARQCHHEAIEFLKDGILTPIPGLPAAETVPDQAYR